MLCCKFALTNAFGTYDGVYREFVKDIEHLGNSCNWAVTTFF